MLISARDVNALLVDKESLPCHRAMRVKAANVPTGAKIMTEFAATLK